MPTEQLDRTIDLLDPTDSALDLEAEVDQTGHILELLCQEFLLRADLRTQTSAAIPSSPGDGLQWSGLGASLRECCRALIARNAANPELLRGLALALGDFSPQEMVAFIRSLPGAAGLPRSRRRSR